MEVISKDGNEANICKNLVFKKIQSQNEAIDLKMSNFNTNFFHTLSIFKSTYVLVLYLILKVRKEQNNKK
jgi:hypothetical protein